MPNSKALFHQLVNSIHIAEDREEIQSIIYLLLEHQFGITRKDVMMDREISFHNNELELFINRINNHEPIQYILGEADFFGRKFFVDPSVLIPRPETELLIDKILKLDLPAHLKILDIGTGSGCIATTLALEVPHANVTATDISEAALSVAKQNATALKSSVQFLNHNILREDINDNFDIIVSNPPYISSEEKILMNKNVLDYEPHLALFSENDPLLFYKHIAAKSIKALTKTGKVLVEINEHFGEETLFIFKAAGFSDCELIKDLQNKDRVIIAKI